jgi:hypothetical protein
LYAVGGIILEFQCPCKRQFVPGIYHPLDTVGVDRIAAFSKLDLSRSVGDITYTNQNLHLFYSVLVNQLEIKQLTSILINHNKYSGGKYNNL